MNDFALIVGITTVALLLGAGVLHLVPRLGSVGRRLSDVLSRAPMLDVLITYFTVAPMIVGTIAGGWGGLGAGVLGQVVAVIIWSILHSALQPKYRRGPRIHAVLNRIVGPWRNYTAVYLTAIVVPLFWLVRMVQIFVYPLLHVLVRFPKYQQADWVNLSRHKFEGLVGHDLIWCLYCDWMTSVWSLGSEMLRNVESFWCPIRFDSAKKCENCRIDFPDLAEWVAADATMAEAAALLERKFVEEPSPDGANSWFGHPARLTVEGKEPDDDG